MRETSPLTTRVGSYRVSGYLGNIFLQGMEEIIGNQETHRILNLGAMESLASIHDQGLVDHPIPFRQISLVQQTLDSLFGDQSGKGLSFRIGQSGFRHGLRVMGWSQVLTGPEFRLLSPRKKVAAGARYLASEINQYSDQNIVVEDEKHCIHWVVQRCPICWGRRASSSICHHTAGFLHEFVTWSTGGKSYSVVENECLASGGENCIFTITKQAFD